MRLFRKYTVSLIAYSCILASAQCSRQTDTDVTSSSSIATGTEEEKSPLQQKQTTTAREKIERKARLANIALEAAEAYREKIERKARLANIASEAAEASGEKIERKARLANIALEAAEAYREKIERKERRIRNQRDIIREIEPLKVLIDFFSEEYLGEKLKCENARKIEVDSSGSTQLQHMKDGIYKIREAILDLCNLPAIEKLVNDANNKKECKRNFYNCLGALTSEEMDNIGDLSNDTSVIETIQNITLSLFELRSGEGYSGAKEKDRKMYTTKGIVEAQYKKRQEKRKAAHRPLPEIVSVPFNSTPEGSDGENEQQFFTPTRNHDNDESRQRSHRMHDDTSTVVTIPETEPSSTFDTSGS